MSTSASVTVMIDGGSTISVPFTRGMTAERAMQMAVNQTHDQLVFTYGTQFFGDALGNLVFMINQTYDTFANKDHPFFFWDFLINGEQANAGVDGTILSDGDVVEFRFTTFDPTVHTGTLLETKLKALRR